MIVSSNLAIIQVTKASDDLLLVQLVSLQLHASYGLHSPVVLEALFSGQHRRLRGALLQTVQLTLLLDSTGKRGRQSAQPTNQISLMRKFPFHTVSRACSAGCDRSVLCRRDMSRRSLVCMWTHLDVKAGLWGEVSEGACGRQHPGPLQRERMTHERAIHTQEIQVQ